MGNFFLATLFFSMMFSPHQASLSSKLQDSTKPSILFSSKSGSEKIQSTTSAPQGHHAFKHLEEHINSLKHLTNPIIDNRIHIMNVPLLFACMDNNSPYENCDKINDFRQVAFLNYTVF